MALIFKERSDLIRKAVQLLPTRQRLVVEMLYFNDPRTIEVAALLDLNATHVYRLKTRALTQLREVILQSGGDIIGIRTSHMKG